MKIITALITLFTIALSASFAVARDANREALWLIERQQQRMYQQWPSQPDRHGTPWMGYQRQHPGTYFQIAPDALQFYGG